MYNIDFNQIKKDEEEKLNKKLLEDTITESSDPPKSKFNVDFNQITESEELDDFFEGLYLEENSRSLSAALAAGYAYNLVYDDKLISEARGTIKKVVRGGKIKDKVVCPPGYKVEKGSCVRMTPADAKAFTRRARKAAKTRRQRKGSTATKTTKSRNRSMLIRQRRGAVMDRMQSI